MPLPSGQRGPVLKKTNLSTMVNPTLYLTRGVYANDYISDADWFFEVFASFELKEPRTTEYTIPHICIPPKPWTNKLCTKNRGELRCAERVDSSCYTSG